MFALVRREYISGVDRSRYSPSSGTGCNSCGFRGYRNVVAVWMGGATSVKALMRSSA